MKTNPKFVFFLALSLTCLASESRGQTIESYKDDLFSLDKRKVLESRNNCTFKLFYWDEMEDVNGRDAIPGQTSKPERVDEGVLKEQRQIDVPYEGTCDVGTDDKIQKKPCAMNTYEVGTVKDAKFAVFFIHGGGGSGDLGVSDYSFGGNFNRIKNIAVKNHGVYYSPTVTFDENGVKGMQAMIDRIKKESPKAKIVISCGSAGAYMCNEMARRKESAAKLAGLVYLGGAEVPLAFTGTPAFAAKVPVLISHGSKDRFSDWHDYNTFYDQVHDKDPDYPIHMELFDGGKHGTPMRMTDWKADLEWMFGDRKAGAEATAKSCQVGKAAPAPATPAVVPSGESKGSH